MNNKTKKFYIALTLFVMALIVLTLSFTNSTTISTKSSAYADNGITPTAAAQKTLTYKGSVSANGLFSRGVSLALPSNIQTGDLLIAVAGTNGPASSWTAPVGWIQGQNSGNTDSQGITWWWKVADGTEAGSSITLMSGNYADGGAVVNVYRGQADNPIAGVSSMATNDNFGSGHVTSANVTGIMLGNTITAVPLIFASWQPNATHVDFPSGFAFESAADDGYSFVAVGEAYNSLTTNTFPGYTLSLSSGQAVVQTLQVLVQVK